MRRLAAVAALAVSLGAAPVAFADSLPVVVGDKIFGLNEPDTVSESNAYPSEDGVASRLASLGAQGHRWEVDGRSFSHGHRNMAFTATISVPRTDCMPLI